MILVKKPLYWTMGQLTRHVKLKHHNDSLTFAGRLDPMAEGLVLYTSTAELTDKPMYMSLEKTYEAVVLFGVTTDSGDLLGLPLVSEFFKSQITERDLDKVNSLVGQHHWRVPLYSSGVIKNLARFKADATNPNSLPIAEMNITSLGNLTLLAIKKDELFARLSGASRIQGDFRQEAILNAWQSLALPEVICGMSFTVTCSSGTYIRTLAEHIGDLYNIPACLYSLKRTRIGEYRIANVDSVNP